MTINNLHNMTLEEIKKQIDQRKQLLKQMVGNLYPLILLAEIDRLVERREEIEQILRNEGLK